MIRFAAIWVLTLGFTACEQNSTERTVPTRGSQSEGVDGGFGDAFSNTTATDVQSITGTSDVQPGAITTNIVPGSVVSNGQPMTTFLVLNERPKADASPEPVVLIMDPCTYTLAAMCQIAACTPDQRNGISFTGCQSDVAYSTSSIYSCGWDASANICYKTFWCGESVPSVGWNDTNGTTLAVDTTRAPVLGGGDYTTSVPLRVHLMPKGAVCKDGKATFAPGTLKVWGAAVKNSSFPAYFAGFMCVLNSQAVTVNC